MDTYRIIVISDTHGSFHALYDIVMKHKEEACCFLHLGDGEWEVEDIKTAFPELTFYTVRGNCDFSSQDPYINEIVVGGKQILFTHGHMQSVNYGLEKLKQTARNVQADIVLYGHTHCGYTGYDDGLYIMNPGSPVRPRDSKASYGIIDITPAGIVLNLVKV
ncbi:MAG: metallophosphoesterase family protein [Massiliimalia sp.]|jgi:putative phosphoesterase